MDIDYVHGYAPSENVRLSDQARTLAELLHGGTHYAEGTDVLEAGCGVGAQTVELARRHHGARITAIDLSADSLAAARERCKRAGVSGVTFEQADILALPWTSRRFDHIFVCFVLEHLPDPVSALRGLRRVLRAGGSITVIEGDHGTTCFHPDHDAARDAIACQVSLQQRAGGNALIGRQLHALLSAAGFARPLVAARTAYADASHPGWVEGFTRRTFIPMIEGVREAALAAELISPARFDAGIQALHRTAEPDGSFCYTFFKATAREPAG